MTDQNTYGSGNTGEKSKEKVKLTFRDNLEIALLVFGIPVAIALVISLRFSEIEKTNVTILKADLLTSIKAGTTLDVVNNIYAGRDVGQWHYPWNHADFSPADTPLSEVLITLKKDLYLEYSKPEMKTIVAIDGVIDEHTKTDPFDKLTGAQKEIFDSIRLKLQDKYDEAHPDFMKLSDELYDQNQLIEEYLGDAKSGLYLSIFGLFIALLFGVYETWENRKLRKLIDATEQNKTKVTRSLPCVVQAMKTMLSETSRENAAKPNAEAPQMLTRFASHIIRSYVIAEHKTTLTYPDEQEF